MPAIASPFFPVPTATPALDAGFSQPLLALPPTLLQTRAGACLANVHNTRHPHGRPVIAQATLCAWSGDEHLGLPTGGDRWSPVWFGNDSMLLVQAYGRADALVSPFALCQRKHNTWKGRRLSFSPYDLDDAMENPELPMDAARAYRDVLAEEIALWADAASRAPRVDPELHPCDRKAGVVPAWYLARPWLDGMPEGLPQALLHALAKRAPTHVRLKPGELTLLGGHVGWDGKVHPARAVATSTAHRTRHAMRPFLARLNTRLADDLALWPLRAQIAPGRSTQSHGAVMLGAGIATLDPAKAPSAHLALAAEALLADG